MHSPFGFLRTPVTLLICGVYIALVVALLYVHHVVPAAPNVDVPIKGVNITAAWRDLQTLSNSFHPFNTVSSDQVRKWLLVRIDEILSDNGVLYEVEDASLGLSPSKTNPTPVIVLNDASNVTFSAGKSTVYFESTNVIVYIRGSEDDRNDWWRHSDEVDDPGKKGVLVNAHYDSVSTGLGATDDGVGVVSILQLINYFTTEGNQPKRGLVALLNNGEEDGLNGAYAFSQHPIAKFPSAFLNLEGAGAGGRAVLFRSTDAEVTAAYRKSPRPFGTVASSDAFSRGLIRSDTDYSVFYGKLGLRGLDVAFFEPRARYHTNEDSSRYTDKDSIWHMLSAAVATTRSLTSDIDDEFKPEEGSNGVWFDVFGQVFGLTTLKAMFGLSVTLLIIAPLFILGLVSLLRRLDKWYLFSPKAHTNPMDPHMPDEPVVVEFGGWKGLTRFPIAFILASVAVLGLAFLLTKINPFIIYSSEYAVWSMMLSVWLVIAWFFLRGADFMRPSALHRAHALTWIFLIMWVVLVIGTIAENDQKIAGIYPLVIYFAATFLALVVAYSEFFALPRRQHYIETVARRDDQTDTPGNRTRASSLGSGQLLNRDDNVSRSSRSWRRGDRDEEPTESTSLLGGKRPKSSGSAAQRSEDLRNTIEERLPSAPSKRQPFGEEQGWSGSLPSWMWVVEFLVLGPIVLIILGPVALFLTAALHHTPADGNSALLIYIYIAILAILFLMPVAPFVHRMSSRIPLFLFLVFVGTLVYNLTAFPFSEQNKLKLFFRQDLDIDTGTNRVSLAGLDGYVQLVIAELPSAAGQRIDCVDAGRFNKVGLVACSWNGLAPNTVPRKPSNHEKHAAPEKRYQDWVNVGARLVNDTDDEAMLAISGRATRACRINFDENVVDVDVNNGSSTSHGLSKVSEGGGEELQLWSREWEKAWSVHVKWGTQKRRPGSSEDEIDRRRLGGMASCIWSDANEPGTIPALDEVKMFMPVWSIVTKLEAGLVVGHRNFTV